MTPLDALHEILAAHVEQFRQPSTHGRRVALCELIIAELNRRGFVVVSVHDRINPEMRDR